MKRLISVAVLGVSLIGVLFFLCTSEVRGATIPPFPKIEFVTGVEGVTYEFTADVAPYTYLATLSDLSWGILEFDYLALSVTTATNMLGSIVGPGSFTFEVTPGATYFANVFGVGGGQFETGLYGLDVSAVPIPASVLMLGSGLIGLLGLRRRLRG